MMAFDVLDHRALERGQVTTVSIPDDLERLQSIACLASKERPKGREVGRNKGIAADPKIAQCL